MCVVKDDLSFEQILEAARRLSEEDQERLIFELSSELRRALQALEAEYESERAAGKTVPLEEFRIVFKVSEEHQEIGVLFLGTRQNFYRDLKRYLRS
ncbi:MAG: hypothetical protein K6T71_06405 [Candidatus Bipolaricaulota bacterium]|nr:hypothetical protein [Candidatus Bipolaricaulota bacterium]